MRRDIQRVALAAIALSTLQGSAAALPTATPAGAQSCQVELVVDQPGENAEITVRERISGWAVDRAAADGTGIEAMRVALDPPETPDEQVFLPLVYGVARPDVAYTLGNPRFARAGFAQEWAAVGTPPGRHRLVIQAKSACGWTTITRTIRVLPASAGADTIQEVLVPLLNNDGSGRLTISDPASPIMPGAPVNALERTPPVPLAVTRQHFPLTAEATGPTSARLTWDAAPGAATYNVYQADESVAGETPNPQNVMRLFGLGGLQRARSGVAETSATLTGLNAGARYRFTVRAVSEAGGEISASEVARVTLPSGPSPNTLAASATGGPGSVALSWTTVADAATYTVLSGSGGSPLVADPQRTHLTATSVSLDRLPPGIYVFQIEARDAAGARLARSNPAQVTVDPTGTTSAAVLSSATTPGLADALSGLSAPSVPAALVPSAAVPGAPPAALASPPGAFAPPVPGPAGVPPAASGAMLLPGVPPGGPLPALGAPGGSPAPSAGLQVRALRAGSDSARLEWPPLPGVAAYAVYQAQGDTPLALAFTTSQPTTTLVGLNRSISYTFQVRARNGADQDIAVSPPVTLTLDQ